MKKIHRGPFYLLALLLPTQLARHFWPSFAFIGGLRIDYLSPTVYLTDILIIIIIPLWLASGAGKTANRRRGFFHKAFLAAPFAVYVSINIFHSASPWAALPKWVKISEFALLAYYIIKTKPSPQTTKALLIFAGLYSSIIAWLQFIKGGSVGGWLYFLGERTFTLATPGIARQSFFGHEYLRPYATFPHPNVLAGFLTASLPFILSGLVISRPFLKAGLLAAWLATIFITGSQAALVISLGILFLFLSKKRIILSTAFFFLLLIFFLLSLFPNYGLRITNYENFTSITRRISLTKAAIDMFKESPVIGIGMNNFIVRLPEFYRLNEPTFFLQPVHNIYLLILAEDGLIGFTLFLGILYKVWKETTRPYSHVATSAGALFLLGLFDHYLLTLQQGTLLFTIILAFAFSAGKK